jgi:voltage-gated potassium channel
VIIAFGFMLSCIDAQTTLFLYRFKLTHIGQLIMIALFLLSSAGAGFYWLEPSVKHYSEGVWLAFTTLAMVGYGDIVPSTPASKVFAVFIIVAANIAALFVSEEEKLLKRDLHQDISFLREEVRSLRKALNERQESNLNVNISELSETNQLHKKFICTLKLSY